MISPAVLSPLVLLDLDDVLNVDADTHTPATVDFTGHQLPNSQYVNQAALGSLDVTVPGTEIVDRISRLEASGIEFVWATTWEHLAPSRAR